jgi:hypothetical protein
VLSIAEVLKKTGEMKSKEEKVNWLRQNNSQPLRNILILTYDKNKEFLVPNTEPPYTPSKAEENQGMLQNQARKLKYFVKGFSPEGVHQIKREQIFIEMLESVHRDDALVLLQMIQKKPFKGITKAIINEAFGEIIKDGKED